MGDYVELLRRRAIYLVTILPAAVFVSILLAYGLPAVYQATATILIEESAVNEKLLPTTVLAAITPNTQIELVRRHALAPDVLKALVARIDPYPNDHDMSPSDKAHQIFLDTTVEQVDPITFEPLVNSTAFSVHYNNPNAVLASKVAHELANIFLDYNRKTRTESAEVTYNFLLAKSKQTETAMREADQKVADFKKHYGAALPEDQVRNEGDLDRTQTELDNTEAQIRVAEQNVAALSLQLSQLSPSMVAAVTDSPTEIATLKSQLADAQQRYTPDHPDIKRLRRALDDVIARQKGAGQSGAPPPDNPDYLSVASQLQSARQNLAALRVIAARAQSQRQTLQSQLAIAPSVEKDYAQLLRDRDQLKDQSLQLQGKVQEADIGRSFESEQQGDRFTLIRSPGIPDSPVSPNRLGLMLIGLVLGGALAIGAAIMAENSDPTVRSYQDVRSVTDVQLLASIPMLLSPSARLRRRKTVMVGVSALAVAGALAGLTVWYSVHSENIAIDVAQTKNPAAGATP
jgi:polysaccharide chain length determinant protein (PEP-CTERM system associated)